LGIEPGAIVDILLRYAYNVDAVGGGYVGCSPYIETTHGYDKLRAKCLLDMLVIIPAVVPLYEAELRVQLLEGARLTLVLCDKEADKVHGRQQRGISRGQSVSKQVDADRGDFEPYRPCSSVRQEFQRLSRPRLPSNELVALKRHIAYAKAAKPKNYHEAALLAVQQARVRIMRWESRR